MFARRTFQKFANNINLVKRSMGSHGHGHHHEPHVPQFYDKLGKSFLLFAYLWILYRAKEDKGQLLGFYKPWLHEHEHEHYEFAEGGVHGDNVPGLVEHEDEDH